VFGEFSADEQQQLIAQLKRLANRVDEVMANSVAEEPAE
jgi:hypothetical protein